ncbi:MAG TPA: toll/interleukin-1 receptor domain-containing protein [Panacibacter sp.]|nr:toll/interleukin-1 receptor domain-containing protein [Panacibacter sp.]
MKIFISHSWKNKTQAQMLTDYLQKQGVDVWIDTENLLPGQPIQESINKDMDNVGLIVLIWSKDALVSDGVDEEIKQAFIQKKIIIPFCIDDTPLGKHNLLKDYKGILVNDWDEAKGRLYAVITYYMMQQFDMHKNQSGESIKNLQAIIEAAGELIHNQNIQKSGSKTDQDFWINSVSEKLNHSKKPVESELNTGKEIEVFLQEAVKELQLAGNDKNKNLAVWEKVKNFKHIQHPAMQKMAGLIKNIVFSIEDKAEPKEAAKNHEAVDKIIERYEYEINLKVAESYQQLKNTFGFLLPDFLFKPLYDGLTYYYTSSVMHVKMLWQLAQQKQTHPIVKDATIEVCNYLSNPAGVIHNNSYGILGYTDDAYVILWVLELLARKGYVDYKTWSTKWNVINIASNTLFAFFQSNIKETLNELVSNLFIVLERKYQPASTEVPNQNNLEAARANLQLQRDNFSFFKIKQMISNL